MLELDLIRNDSRYKANLVAAPLNIYNNVVDGINNILHPAEIGHFKKLKYMKRKLSYFMGRYAAKKAVSTFLSGDKLKDIEIISTILGNPVVRCAKDIVPSVSISHNNNYAVALAYPDKHPMAIDIELIDESKVETIKSQVTEAEERLFEETSLTEAVYYTVLWTIKEALSKFILCGLTIPFDLLEINRIEIEEERIVTLFKNFGQYKACSYILDGQVVSVVLPRKTELQMGKEELKRLFP